MQYWHNSVKNITTTSENTGTLLSQNVARQMPLMPDLIVFFSSIVASTANEQFLDCATIAFSEAYSISWGKGGGSFKRNQSKHKAEEHGETHKHGVIRIAIKREGNETTRMNTTSHNEVHNLVANM